MPAKTHPFSSEKNAVFYIAEVGGNHQGDYAYAQELTRLGVLSGADAVKLQFYTGDTLVSRVEDVVRNAHFKQFELTDEQNMALLQDIKDAGVIPMASVWSKQILIWSDPYLPVHKVGSGDLTCYPMLALLAATGKPLILSTGLSSMAEVDAAVTYVERCDPSYIRDRKLALLQCTAAYPTPDEEANIDAMVALRSEFGLPVGYSDHTLGMDGIEAAVALGAEIIEKHFTDTREDKTFRDHLASLTCEEVRATLAKMKRIVTLKGQSEKVLTESEKEAKHHVSFRRSIYAAQDIAAGEILTPNNLTVLRPALGVCASRFDDVTGRTAVRAIGMHELIRENDFS